MNETRLVSDSAEALSLKFNIPPISPKLFFGMPEPCIELDLETGKVMVPPGMMPDEAARMFWQCVEQFAYTEMGRLRREVARLKGEGDETIG